MAYAQDSFSNQIDKFKKEDAARWKYLKAESDRQSALAEKVGDRDERYQRELAKAGTNVETLFKDSREDAERSRANFEEIKKIDPPPIRNNLVDADALRNGVFEIPDTNIWIFPPPDSVEVDDSEIWGVNADLAEFNIKRHDEGSGTGIGAVGVRPQEGILWFHYVPPTAGNLLVEPHLNFKGVVSIWIENHWYTTPAAALRVSAYLDLHQHYWDGQQTEIVVDEDRGGSTSVAYWVDKAPPLSKSLSVSAGVPVYIKIGVVIDYCYADAWDTEITCDFRTGADRRIRLDYIRLRLD